jgi:hypothetical protein
MEYKLQVDKKNNCPRHKKALRNQEYIGMFPDTLSVHPLPASVQPLQKKEKSRYPCDCHLLGSQDDFRWRKFLRRPAMTRRHGPMGGDWRA